MDNYPNEVDMKLFFLEADMPLVKTFETNDDGSLTKEPYPNAYRFTSHEVQCASLVELHKAIKAHALKGHCLLKGNLKQPLHNEPRAGSTNPDEPTDWICLDFDGAPFDSVDAALNALSTPNSESPFADVSYIVQYSASQGFKDGLNCHVFMQLSNNYLPAYLKAWLQTLNMACPAYNSALHLNATGTHMSWPLDVTTCQNDKLLFIAPPQLINTEPRFNEKERYQLVKKDKATFPVDRIPMLRLESIKRAVHDRRNELRDANGMHKMRINSTKLDGNYYTVVNPGEAIITGPMRESAGFVHFNLNGGDSWSYYHPIDNHEFVYCFKHEDERFRTSELLPSYYKRKEEERIARNAAPTEEGSTLLAFSDKRSGSYWRGSWNPSTCALELHPARSTSLLDDWLMAHGRDPLEFVPVLDLVFDPTSNVVLDAERRVLNTYVPTAFMRNSYPAPREYTEAETKKMLAKFPTIDSIMRHVISNGQHDELYEFWLNWCAVKYQTRGKVITAWLFRGVEGTGKNIIAEEILAPTLGHDYVQVRRGMELEEHYNGWLENRLICFFDEVEVGTSDNRSKIQSNLRNYITQPEVTIRHMHRQAFKAKNYTSFIFASNKNEVLHLNDGDRRYNVGVFQNEKLYPEGVDFAAVRKTIRAELPHWMNYIMTRKADVALASTSIKNDARSDLIETSRNSIDQIAKYLVDGNFMELFGELPNMDLEVELHGMNTAFASHYDQIIRREAALIVDNATELTAEVKRSLKLALPVGVMHARSRLTREELQTIFEYTVGNTPSTPAKMSKFLRHRGIHISTTSFDGDVARGTYIDWYVTKQQFEGLKKSLSPRVVSKSDKPQTSHIKTKLTLAK